MRLPNSLFRLLGGLLVLFLFSSCSSAWYMASNNYNNDPIYGIVESTGDTIKIDVLDSEWDINRKFRFDNKFRWNYSMYAMNQDYIWHQDFFWRNRMFRNGYGFSSWDFYWNRHNFWWNWSAGYPFNNYWGYWDSTWGWQGYGFYYPNYWNDRYWFRNNWRWNDRNRRDVAYINGRRGSNGVIVTPNGSRGNGNSIIANPNVRINVGRGNGVVRNYNVKPNPNDVDVVIEKPNRTFIGRLFDKIEDAGVKVRTYDNPNNVPNNIRVIPRNNNNNIRNYNTPPRVNNNIRSSSPPVRSYSPPPSSNISRGSSSGGAVISRGSRSNNID